jgi:hypothetical protein
VIPQGISKGIAMPAESDGRVAASPRRPGDHEEHTMSNTSTLSRRARLHILVSVTLTAICLGGASASPASAIQNTDGCSAASPRALGIDEIVEQRKTGMAADYVTLALERAQASYGRG